MLSSTLVFADVTHTPVTLRSHVTVWEAVYGINEWLHPGVPYSCCCFWVATIGYSNEASSTLDADFHITTLLLSTKQWKLSNNWQRWDANFVDMKYLGLTYYAAVCVHGNARTLLWYADAPCVARSAQQGDRRAKDVVDLSNPWVSAGGNWKWCRHMRFPGKIP